MTHSESIKEIATALVKFDAEVAKIKKGSENPFFKNKYARLPDILDAIKEPLNKCGLTVKQFPVGSHQLSTLVMHTSGEWLESTYEMRPSKDDPQGEGSRITYQRRYALGAVLGLNIDEDDDGNKASAPAKRVEVSIGDANFTKIVAAIKAKTATLGQALDKFAISPEVEAEIVKRVGA